MSTASLFSVPSDRPTISFELYPPRSAKGALTLQRTVGELAAVQPDFFSITYGAAGKTRDASRDLIRQILADTEVTPIAHLTCVGASQEELRGVITDLLDEGVRDFLALRGDPPAGEADWQPHPEGLQRSSELVRLLRKMESERFGTTGEAAALTEVATAPGASSPAGPVQPVEGTGGVPVSPGSSARTDLPHPQQGGSSGPHRINPLSISVAAYPGGQHDVTGQPVVSENDVKAMLEKQAAGADFAITQLFFHAGHYTELVRRARDAGVHIPIVPGVIPLTDAKRLRRLEELTGVPVPQWLLDLLEGAPDEREAYRRGLAASRELLAEVIDAGAPGLHIYTFNKAAPALDLLDGAGLRPAHSLS